MTAEVLEPLILPRLAGDDALAQQEAAIGAGIADLHHGEGLSRHVIEGEALDAGERGVRAQRRVEELNAMAESAEKERELAALAEAMLAFELRLDEAGE